MPAKGKKAGAKKNTNAYKMPAPIATGEVIYDHIVKKKWQIGPSIGVGGFGEIYSACEHDSSSNQRSGFPFVIKIEPHENGPLFVEKHFYIRNANKDDIAKYMKNKKLTSLGMPTYFGNGSHDYNGEKYRYLVLERYGKDLWSVFKDAGRTFPATTVFIIGLQMLDVLEYIHSRGYVHADIKGANILLGLKKGTENQTYLVDFGLATRLNDKEFKPDPKCAHNGTIEYTSRDAHLGVATIRGDLEILGYNMLQWIVGELPWENSLKRPKVVESKKRAFMDDVRSVVTKDYSIVPDALIKYMEYINTLGPAEAPDYAKCRQLLESHLRSEGKTRSSELEFTRDKKAASQPAAAAGAPATKGSGDVRRRAKRPEKEPSQEKVKRSKKQVAETETDVVPEVTRARLPATATPPAKKNHANIAVQTSLEKPRRSPRLVKTVRIREPEELDSSGDIFDDSYKIEDEKVKRKRKLLSDEKVTVKRVRKTVTTARKGPTWKESPAVVNGRPPKK